MFIGIGNIVGKSNYSPASIINDAQAFFDRVTAAGGSLTLTEKNAIIQLIVDMKSAGVWTKVKAAYPMVGGTQSSCMQNLKSFSFTGIPQNTLTYSSTGATGNGTNSYIDTQFNPFLYSNIDSAHLGFYSRTNIVGSSPVDIGVADDFNSRGYSNVILDMSSLGAGVGMHSNANTPIGILGNSLGFLMANRVNNTQAQAWKNGSNVLTYSSNSITPSDANIYIFCLNYNASGTFNPVGFSPRQCAFATMGDGLTNVEAAAYYTAIQTFQTALSRQV